MLQRTGHTVLLIEADRSLRRLIALGLQYRGMHVIEADFSIDVPGHFTPPDFCEAQINAPSSLEAYLQKIVEAQQPDIVVLDIDSEALIAHVDCDRNDVGRPADQLPGGG